MRGLIVLGPVRLMLLCLTLMFAAFWLWAAIFLAVLPVGDTPYNRLGGVAGSDFVFFYPVGVLAAQGRIGDVYHPKVLSAAGRELFTDRLPELVWPYPPTAAMPLAALGTLPPRAALWAWIAIAWVALLAAARVALGSWRKAPLIALCPAVGLALFAGQVSPLLLLALAIPAMQTTNTTLSGTAIGLLSLKPHFGVIPGLFALAARRFKDAAVAVAVTAGLAAVSVAVFGVAAWVAFVNLGLAHSQSLRYETPSFRLVSVYAAAVSFGIPNRPAMVVHLVVAIAAIAVGFAMWRRAPLRSQRALGYVSATLLATPYVLDYDLALLALPWLLIIDEVLEQPALAREQFVLWMALTLLAPVTYLVGLYSRYPVGGLLLFGIVAVTYWIQYAPRPLNTALNVRARM